MKKLNTWIKKEEGFTLIEMSLVLFIISTLLLLFVPNIASRQDEADDTGNEAIVTVLQSQADMYKIDKGKAAATFKDLFDGKYLTEKQLEKTAGFTISNGIVTKVVEQ